MLLLFESVLLLNYELAAVLAEEVAVEPGLGRPREGEQDSLNALLPAAFFAHQDRLRARARRLAVAARSQETEAVIAAFANVTESCVACHAAYLYGDEGDPAGPWLHDEESASVPRRTSPERRGIEVAASLE